MPKSLKRISILLVVFLILILLVPIPSRDMDFSKVVYDKEGRLLSASIASDGQWRFPIQEDIPPELEQCITTFEDEYFYKHIGVNPVSIGKALRDNIRAGKIVRGGSTITMQVMRMYRGNKSRNAFQKIIEIMGAFKLELLRSKKEILHTWATIAPFGGNTVGAQTAAIRYFKRKLDKLSWSEYATLAVLPNAPSAIHLKKNRNSLLKKRNLLLDKLYENKAIDSLTWVLSKDENLPKFNGKIEQKGLHFLEFLKKKYPDESIFNSTIDTYLQRESQNILNEFAAIYQYDGINNISAVIIDNQSNEVLSYIGNVNNKNGNIQYVDCTQGLRSYGSLLKPFLYSYAIENGYFLPEEIIKDIPTNINGYAPLNYDKKYRGAIPMSQVISHSLNIPAVRLLNYVGLESFHDHFRNKLGVKSVNPQPNHHGLSLILGGAEASLWDMARLYKGLIRNHYELENPYSEVKTCQNKDIPLSYIAYHPSTVWHTISAMKNVNRPREEQQFSKLIGDEIAWKTGTSFGHRDAWAIGCNERYTVAVWVGNQTGEGMYKLTGVTKAAPVLFRLLRILPSSGMIKEHLTEAESVTYCAESGQLIGRYCKNKVTAFIPRVSHQLRNCNHHEVVNGDTTFVLDPVISYYKDQFNGIKPKKISKSQIIKIVYPTPKSIIQLPLKLDHEYAQLTTTANANYKTELFWFLNEKFIQKTTDKHEIQIPVKSGSYQLIINDTNGHKNEVVFEVAQGE